MPVTKDTDEIAKIEYFALGFFKAFQSRFKKPGWSLDMGWSLQDGMMEQDQKVCTSVAATAFTL
jgi:hypothetical protein